MMDDAMSGFASIVETSTMPVSAQMTTVDQNVPVIATSACCAGLRVEAAEATMGAEPRPDSLENRPRAQPNCSAIMRPEPTAPPNAAFGVKAHSKIRQMAGHTNSQFMPMITMQPHA